MRRLVYLDFFNALENAKVRYLAVGGLPVLRLGIRRLTPDLELLISPTQANLDRLFRMQAHGARRTDPSVRVIACSAVAFEEAYARREVMIIDGYRIAVAARFDIHGFTETGPEVAEDDFWYKLTEAQLARGLARTPIERLVWLDEARRFALRVQSAELERCGNGTQLRF
jgi:hypothetical protein